MQTLLSRNLTFTCFIYIHIWTSCFKGELVGSSVSTLFYYRLDDRGSIPCGVNLFFPLAFVSRPAVISSQPAIQWVPGSFPGGKLRPGLYADHSPHLVPRSRMSGICTSFPPWHLHYGSGTALLYLLQRVNGQAPWSPSLKAVTTLDCLESSFVGLYPVWGMNQFSQFSVL
jgi:hypothetical protein